MSPDTATPKSAQQELLKAIEGIKRRSMGLDVLEPLRVALRKIRPGSRAGESSPAQSGSLVALIYVSIFFGLPVFAGQLVAGDDFDPDPGLYALQVYGALWAWWATVTTNAAVRSLCWIIEHEIAPHLQDETCRAIAAEIGAKFAPGPVLALSWSFGVIFAALAGCLIWFDLQSRVTMPEVIFWSMGWCLLFATSTGVVIIGQFYAVIAEHIHKEAPRIYIVDPAKSQLLRSVASLGERMILFWLGIAVSIALIFLVQGWRPFGLSESWFVVAQVTGAGFFSLGVGSWVFLKSQAAIRRASRAAVGPILRAIETEARTLQPQGADGDDARWTRLDLLDKWHARITTSPSLQSRVSSVVSVTVPLIPLVTAIVSMVAKG